MTVLTSNVRQLSLWYSLYNWVSKLTPIFRFFPSSKQAFRCSRHPVFSKNEAANVRNQLPQYKEVSILCIIYHYAKKTYSGVTYSSTRS